MITYGTAVDFALTETIPVGAGDTLRHIRKYTLEEIYAKGLWLENYGSGDWSLITRSEGYEEVKA